MFAGRKFLRISRTALHPRKFPAAKMSKLRFPNVIGMGEEAESAKISCRKSGLAARAAKFSGRKHFPNYSMHNVDVFLCINITKIEEIYISWSIGANVR